MQLYAQSFLGKGVYIPTPPIQSEVCFPALKLQFLFSSPVLDGRLARAVPFLLPAANEADGTVAILTNAFLGTLATVVIDPTPVLAAGLLRVHHGVPKNATIFAVIDCFITNSTDRAIDGGRSGSSGQKEQKP